MTCFSLDGAGRRARRQRAALAPLALAIALAAAGCGEKHPQPVSAPVPAPAANTPAPPPVVLPQQSAEERLLNALTLLSQGKAADARASLVLLLSERPDDRVGLDLMRQIDTDPKQLLGERNYAYVIRRGETLSSIAGRLLGDRNRFWALARYNGIAVPEAAETGRVIRIPGTAPVAAPAPRPPAPTVVEAQPPRSQPAAPARNPAEAGRLRQVGLAEMARGQIDRAVRSLERALGLDPANATILGDLTRARRVQATLRGR